MTIHRHAWADSGVEEVTPFVHRIPMALPNDALRAVNVYAVHGTDGVGLVDAGWSTPGGLESLARGLGEIDLRLEDVSVVLATHYHPDHYTLAIELRRVTGCPVLLGANERTSLEAILDGSHGLDDFSASLRRSGVPGPFVRAHLSAQTREAAYEWPTSWLEDGDRPAIGGREVLALATPGHTRGHFCFADDDAGMLFAGDHVLPHITPSIGFEAVTRHLPLADYLDSLRRMHGRSDARLLPAHGPVSPSVHARVDELLKHHEVRLRRCGDAVAKGARTAWEVAQRIPWTSRDCAFDDLRPFDRLMAVHEAQAHLAVLELQGDVIVEDEGDAETYSAA